MVVRSTPQIQGVVTTGIYCRADCSAQPLAKNVRPYPSMLAAAAAGFRPCLRCRPDRLAGERATGADPAVEHALQLITDGFLDHESSDALAAVVGYSGRQLRRLFIEQVGASPDFVARSRRAHFARRLLDESELSVTEVAFAAGFRSERQMHRVMRELFRFSPSALRAKRRNIDRRSTLDGGLRLRVPYIGPMPVNAMINYLGFRAIPGVEEVVDDTYRRTLSTCGHPGVIEVRDGGDGQHLDVTAHLPTYGSIIDDVARIRRLFRADVDPAPAADALQADQSMRRSLAAMPGLRLPGAWDHFETAIRIVVGQQVSVAGASTMMGRIAGRWGTKIDVALPGSLRCLFPGPDTLADADLTTIGLTRARAATVAALAAAVADGRVDLGAVGPIDEVVGDLCELPGIGPWTAHLIAARAGLHPDAFPASDLGLRKTIERWTGRPHTAAELDAWAQRCRPFRTTAAAYLWFDPASQSTSKSTSQSTSKSA